MAIVGSLLKNKRAGQGGLAWNLPVLAGPETLGLHSADFPHEGQIPLANAARRVGGQEVSPGLAWDQAPEGTAQLLLVVEDVDAPTRQPFVHCLALLEADLVAVPAGGLDKRNTALGVRVLRAGMGRGYLGPAPIKGHGPHRYVFELFALGARVPGSENGGLDSARPRAVLEAVTGPVLARGRLDGFYTR